MTPARDPKQWENYKLVCPYNDGYHQERNQERKEKYWSSPTSLVPSSLPRQTPEEQQQRVLKQQKEKSYMEYASVSFKVRKVQLGRRALGRRTPPSSRRRDGIGRGPDLAFQPLFRLPTRLWEQMSSKQHKV